MSSSTVLGITPDRHPVDLLVLRNSWGWGARIWSSLKPDWFTDDAGFADLGNSINELPEYQQAALVLTFDVGVIPFTRYAWAAEMLREFDARHPMPETHANHIPAVADLLLTSPEAPFIGVHVTSVSDNPFKPWDDDDYAAPLGIDDLFVLDIHQGDIDLLLNSATPRE